MQLNYPLVVLSKQTRFVPVLQSLSFVLAPVITGLITTSCTRMAQTELVIDKTGKEIARYTAPGGEGILEFSEGLAPIGNTRGYGYIDHTGTLLIPKQYKFAHRFSEGLAHVEVDSKNWRRRYGFIDKTGKMVIPARFQNVHPFSQGLAYAVEYASDADSIPSKTGFIDKTGKFVIDTAFNVDETPFNVDDIDAKETCNFREGLAPALHDDEDGEGKHWGFIDKSGKYVVTPSYDWAGDFGDGLAAVWMKGKFGYVDHHGKVVVPLKYDDARRFVNGMAAVRTRDLWGYVDTTGKEMIAPQYVINTDFSEGMAVVNKGAKVKGPSWGKVILGGKYMLIDKSGKSMYSVENPQDKQGLFNITGSPPSEGLVAVRDLNDHWGYMNKSGQMVIKPNFRSASSFHDGVALVVPER